MNHTLHNTIANFIWGIADDCLRDIYVRGKYRDVILPMIVIRRLDALLEPTKEAVLKMKASLDAANIANQESALCQAAKQAFFNASPYTLRDLKNRTKAQQLKADFEAYLDGFSANIQEILDKFKFRNQIPTLIEADILGMVIEKFLDKDINLSPDPVLDDSGDIKLPGLDNHAMGTIFEELVRRFNEANNEEAGEHWTPRDVVRLMADLIFMPIADQMKSSTYLLYDGTCGTGGMLTVAEERLQELAKKQGKQVSIHLHGQEISPETYAIAKADLLLKGEGQQANNIKYGSTLSADAFPAREFHFMLSNPPYGKSWKGDLERLGGKNELKDPRFVVQHGDNSDYKMITRSSDGQLLFLVNKLSKMQTGDSMGSRIAEVHNGSSLFTGDAGQGESNIRRWIIENDWLEAIIALPENMFYNTGIATYIWLLSNHKTQFRQNKVQLIDASQWYEPLRKNLGKKNCQLSAEHIKNICDLVVHPRETEQSKIFPNETFGYWKIIVERPLRLRTEFSETKFKELDEACIKAKEKPLSDLAQSVATELGDGPHLDFNLVLETIKTHANKQAINLTAKRKKLLQNHLAETDENAKAVIKKRHKAKKAEKSNPLHGLYTVNIGGKPWLVEYEADTQLRDSEQVPLLEEGGIEAFFRREVLPYVADAWIDANKTQIGYEISFTRYFYKPTPMRTLEEIKAEISSLERETEGLLQDIVGEAEV